MPQFNSKDSIATLILLSFFVLFLGYAAWSQSFCFDASYNLISYQNLFLGKGFGYDYNGQWIPFDPVISTGPELYLPALFLWFLTGTASYWTAIYVLVFYYVLFFVFLFFFILGKSRVKLFAFSMFLPAFFCRQQFFLGDAAFIAPIGEPLSVFFIFSGIYLLIGKKSRILSFILIGLGLDTKTNTVIGILPVLAVIYFAEFLYPAFSGKDHKRIFRDGLTFLVGAFLVLSPMLLYTKIAPALFLDGNDKKIWENSVKERKQFMLERGFGHIAETLNTLKKADLKSAALTYSGIFKSKIIQSKSFFCGSFLLTGLYFIFFGGLTCLAFRHKHFSLYIFLFAFFIYSWWFFGAGDAWYRYWVVADFMVLYGFVSLAPVFYEKMKKSWIIAWGLLFMSVFLPQFSSESIVRHLGNTSREDCLKMSAKISDIDESRIFTYGWFQAPYFMILTGKRFNDFQDSSKLASAISKSDDVYFLTTIENTLIADEMKLLEPALGVVAEYGFNRLYKITSDRSVMDSVQTSLANFRR